MSGVRTTDVPVSTSSRPSRPRRRRTVLAATLALATAALASVAGGATVTADQPADSNVLLVTRHRAATGPLGPISVIGDSVLLGSAYWRPALDDELLARGWGPVRIRTGVGYSTGALTSKTEVTAPYWIRRWRAEGWDPVDIVVNIGANDSATCAGNVDCAYDAIMHVVDAIGPGHRIWWPYITRHPAFVQDAIAWNQALDRVVAERDDVFTWDWPSVMYSLGPVYASDHTHLTRDGYVTRSRLMSHEITASLASARRGGTDAPLPSPSGPASAVVPLEPVRVVDTRRDPPGRMAAGDELVVDVSDHVPDGTTAVAAYVTAARTGSGGYLTAYDCDDPRPVASSVNYRARLARGAVAITPVSDDGRFCLYTSADADLVVDLQAAFVPVAAGGDRLTPLDVPQRLVDTRQSGKRRIVEVAVPAGATAVSVTVTAIRGSTPGFLTAFPCNPDDEVPLIATVNHRAREVVAGAAFVKVGDEGTICVYADADAHVTVDLTGVFSPDGELVFEPVPPARMLDTRNGTGGWSPIHGTGQTLDVRVAPARAEAVSGTITLVNPHRTSWVRAWGCGDHGTTANVNADLGQVFANSLTTGIDPNGRLCLYAANAGNTLFDTSGWWVPAPTEAPADR